MVRVSQRDAGVLLQGLVVQGLLPPLQEEPAGVVEETERGSPLPQELLLRIWNPSSQGGAVQHLPIQTPAVGQIHRQERESHLVPESKGEYHHVPSNAQTNYLRAAMLRDP